MSRIVNKSTLPYRLCLMITDIFFLNFVLWIVLDLIMPSTRGYNPDEYSCFESFSTRFTLLFISYALAITTIRIRLTERGERLTYIILRAIGQSLLTVAIFSFLNSIIFKVLLRKVFAWQLLLTVVALIATHVIMTLILRHVRKSGGNALNVVFIGGDHNNRSLYADMKSGFGVNGYNVLGFFTSTFCDRVSELSGAHILGDVHEAVNWLEANNGTKVHELYCALSPSSPKEKPYIDSLIKYCEDHFVKFFYVPNMDGYLKRRMEFSRKGRVTVVSLYNEPLTNPVYRAWKRVMDILISLTFIVTVFWWLFIIIGIGVKISSPGPILFKQKRTGYNGKAFNCLKFRSMRVSADANTKQATADDPRKTKFGDFLRRTSLDELPQFLNVLIGDMSIIGPRPHMEHHTEVYSELISDYMVRHLVRPGITGWAQVNGCRGETKTLDEMKDRVEHDIWYIENWTPALDILIFAKTITQICGGDGQAY